jgi:cbb3-type cytochrome oxidase subunit 3
MKLSDVVGGSGLAMFAEVALIIFFVAFVAIAISLLLTRRADHDRAAHLPFDDGTPPSPPRERAD